MPRPPLPLAACVVTIALLPAPLLAQGKDDFVRAVVDAINADQQPPERRGAAMAAAVEAMAAGLAGWDAAVARVEAGLAADIGGAPPATAARMRMALGAVYLERGRFEDAVGQFERAAALAPAAADPHAFRGLALERLPKPLEAIDAFRQAWQRDRANPVHAYRFLRAARGRPAEPGIADARADLLAAVDASSVPGAAQFALVTADLLDDTQAATPMLPTSGHAEAFTLLRRGRYDQAVARFRADPAAGTGGGRLSPADVALADPDGLAPLVGAAPLFARLGREAHVRLDLDTAAAAYERRVTATPNDRAAHFELADVYRARDDVDAAIVEAAAAALLEPSAAPPLVMIGQLHQAAGRDGDALRMLQRAVGLAPDDAEARYGFSRALLRAGRPEEAQRELDVFKQLQAKAMAEQRRQFEENFRMIEKTLQQTPPQGDPR